MALHKWRKRPSRHFGDVWVPLAQIELQGTERQFQTLAIPIDSGAVVSLLRRSVAELLGLELESGREIDVAGVGGGKTIAYVHTITTKFADRIVYPVNYAIAETERVPNLLGRLDVFDNLQIDFDGTFKETNVSAPWLQPGQRMIWEELIATESGILGSLSRLGLPKPVNTAIHHFLTRGEQILASTRAMLKAHVAYAGPAIVRAMFELAMQFEYLLCDPEARSQPYLDYIWVTRYRQSTCVTKNPTGSTGVFIANSPLRVEGEPRNKKEYDRVLPQFRKGKDGVWENWYRKTVYDLAKELGWSGEYDLIYKSCAAWTHGDPFSSASGPVHTFANPSVLFVFCVTLYARMLRRVAKTYATIMLTPKQITFLDAHDIKLD